MVTKLFQRALNFKLTVTPFGNERVDALTGLRGFAILFVLVSHLANAGYLPGYLGKGAGQIGVMLFFILSGFLMSRLYLPVDPSAGARARFFRARIGRVVPLFMVVVLASFAAGQFATVWPYPIDDTAVLVQHLLFVSGVKELWAVPVEVQFYAIFFVIWLATHQRPNIGGAVYLALVLCLLPLCALAALLYHLDVIAFRGVFYYAPYFLIGTSIPVFLPFLKRCVDRIIRFTGAAAASGLTAVLLASCFPAFKALIGLRFPIWIDPSVAVVVTAVFLFSYFEIGVFRIMKSRILIFLGTISYGLYLLHPIVLTLVGHALPGWNGLAAAALIVALSTALAVVSYYAFEKPALRAVKNAAQRSPVC